MRNGGVIFNAGAGHTGQREERRTDREVGAGGTATGAGCAEVVGGGERGENREAEKPLLPSQARRDGEADRVGYVIVYSIAKVLNRPTIYIYTYCLFYTQGVE